MNAADIRLLDSTLARLHRMFNRRAPTESDIKLWFDELIDFSTADVIDVLNNWERTAEEDHPPTLRWVKRACSAKKARHEAARAQRTTVAQISGDQPMRRAFAQLWADTGGNVTLWPQWRTRIASDPHAPEHLRQFVERLPEWNAARNRPLGTPNLRPIGAQMGRFVGTETDAEREAREEREAIQAEGA